MTYHALQTVLPSTDLRQRGVDLVPQEKQVFEEGETGADNDSADLSAESVDGLESVVAGAGDSSLVTSPWRSVVDVEVMLLAKDMRALESSRSASLALVLC